MADLHGFNANEIEPIQDLEPIPTGKYPAVIIESERKANKAGTGYYLLIVFQILEGLYKGRRLWSRLNLEHTNPLTVQIARAELSAICRAVGVLAPSDSTELHNLPLVVHVRSQKRQDTGELTNEVTGYSKRTSSAAPSTPAPGTGAPPWKRS
jgi:hypothetical protein